MADSSLVSLVKSLRCWLLGGCSSVRTDDPRVRVCPRCNRRIEIRYCTFEEPVEPKKTIVGVPPDLVVNGSLFSFRKFATVGQPPCRPCHEDDE